MRILDLIGSKLVDLGDGRSIALEYYILSTFSKGDGQPLYGVVVRKQEGELVEEEVVEAMSDCRGAIEEIAKILFVNTVTPMCLVEVIDELADKRIYG